MSEAAGTAVQQVTEAAERGEATARASITGIQETAKQCPGRGAPDRRGGPRGARETAEEAERQAADGSETGEPWIGYDDQTVEEINDGLKTADQDLARRVRDYERRHEERSMVLERAHSKAA